MLSGSEKSLLSELWKEEKDISSLKLCKSHDIDKLTGQIVHLAYCGSTTNSLFVAYLKDGIEKKALSPECVVDYISKLSLGKKLKCFNSAMSIMDKCTSIMRYDNIGISPLKICICLSKINFWLLENTIEVYKSFYSCMEGSLNEDVNNCVKHIDSSQALLNKYVFSKDFEDLSYIGKLLYGEEEVPAVQLLIRDLYLLQPEKVSSNPLHSTYENSLKIFMKCMTRFLNSTPIYCQVDRIRGENPNKQLHAMLQIQVLKYLFLPGFKIAELYDTFLKLENLSLDLFILDLLRFLCHNILARGDPTEQSMFISFLYIKIPMVFHHFLQMYKQQNGCAEKAILTSLQQFHQLTDISIKFFCDASDIFYNQLAMRKIIDGKQKEMLIKTHQGNNDFPLKDNNIIDQHLNLVKSCSDILSGLNLPYNENKELLDKNISNLINSPDLMITLVSFAACDKLDLFLTELLRINVGSERCPDNVQDTQHEMRGEIFNNTFILLAYIDAKFGDMVFDKVSDDFPNSFYLKWRKGSSNIVCRKMFSQPVFNNLMENVYKSNAVATSKACWDEYCWSAGVIVKEMTQAHLRRHISTEILQKTCEHLKNKHPSLSIAAIAWLCTQYKTMPLSERIRTVKVINLLQRPFINNQERTAIYLSITSRFSHGLGNDLTSNAKKKTIPNLSFHSGKEQFLKAVEERSVTPCNIWMTIESVLLFSNILKEIQHVQFAENIVKLILESENEESSRSNANLCMCILLVEPVKLLQTIFTVTLKNMFNSTKYLLLFSEPQGGCLAKCLSHVLYITLMVSHTDKEDKLEARSAKSMKFSSDVVSDHQLLVDSLCILLEDCSTVLLTKERNAVSSFILTLIEDIANATAFLKPQIKVEKDVAVKCLEALPSTVNRDVIAFLCDLSTNHGQTLAADFVIKRKKYLE